MVSHAASRTLSSLTKEARCLSDTTIRPTVVVLTSRRCNSSLARSKDGYVPSHAFPTPAKNQRSALSRLPTSTILRSLVLGSFLTSPILFKPGFAILHKVAHSSSRLLNPDKNPLLRAVVKPLIYNHFCAGTNESEIKQRVSTIRDLGFSGVILAYGKEIQIYDRNGSDTETSPLVREHDEEIDLWKKGNLETLAMLQDQDFLAMKLTGAGISVTNTLLHDGEPPAQLCEAMDAICELAAERNCRIIVDAEQQFLQRAIDRWTIDWMRKYNRNGKALIYQTLQAYLKESRPKLQHQLSLSQKEGWTLAIKLVRGAYISNDIRERIHDTKGDTDKSYNSIVEDVLRGTLPGFDKTNFPKMELFIAGHNQISVDKATALIESLANSGKLKTVPEFGQLQGMADELGCKLLHRNDELRNTLPADRHIEPRVYKYMTWGTVQECMEYLVRRAVENRGAADRMKEDMSTMGKELRARLVNAFTRRS